MGHKKYNKKALVGVALILVLINSAVLIITDGLNQNLAINIVLYIIEIIVTIWIITGSDIFKK